MTSRGGRRTFRGGKRLCKFGSLFPKMHDAANFSHFTPEFCLSEFLWSRSLQLLKHGSSVAASNRRLHVETGAELLDEEAPAWGGEGDLEM